MGDPGGMMQGPAMRASVLLAIGVLAIAHGVMEEDMAVQDLGGGDPAGDRAIEDQVLAEAKMSNHHINSADQEDRIDAADDSDFSASKDPKRQLQRAAEGSDSFQNESKRSRGLSSRTVEGRMWIHLLKANQNLVPRKVMLKRVGQE